MKLHIERWAASRRANRAGGSVRCQRDGGTDVALVMLQQIPPRKQVTVGREKGFDTRDFVAECRHLE